MRLSFYLVVSFLLFSSASFAQSKYYLHNTQVALPRTLNTINIIHVEFDSTIKAGSLIEAGHAIGHADQAPMIRSVRYGLQLIDSEAAYEKGQYAAAAAALEEAGQREPQNPFVIYQLARSLYKLDDSKPQAYTLYKRLITQLDEAGSQNDSTLNVDVWFAEAYWKLGTLYMDNQQWPEAVVSISQFLLAAPEEDYKGTPLQEQVLAYLTECFYSMSDRQMCQYYGELTLKLFPQNQYVKPYLAELRRTAPTAQKKPARKASGGRKK